MAQNAGVKGSLAEIEQEIKNGTASGSSLGAVLQALVLGVNATVPTGDALATGKCWTL